MAMATRLLPLQSILHLFQPVQIARQPLLQTPVIRRILNPTIPASLPLAAFAGISDVLRELWEGLLRAVPKKKVSHMKKRHRQMAGKALKDVTHLVKCSACGKPKRAHVLCPYCVQAVRTFLAEKVDQIQGLSRLRQSRPNKNLGGPNIAENAPEVWEEIKWTREKKAKREAKERKDDKTRW